MDLADTLHRECERVGRMVCIEYGKPYWQAQEIDGTLGYLRMVAEGARRIEGDILPSDFEGGTDLDSEGSLRSYRRSGSVELSNGLGRT